MHVDVRKRDDVVILDLSGKLTAGLGDQILRESIDELLGEGFRKILINMSGVGFMDSAGVGELVSGLRTARRLGADLRLLNVGDRLQSSLSMARLLPIFTIHQSEDEALTGFAQA
jgi:anti-sigma B factor antagonist